MTERKLPYGKEVENRSSLPKAPSLPEEPIVGVEPGKIVCPICSRTFKTHTQFDRHYESAHGTPEKTHNHRHDLPHP